MSKPSTLYTWAVATNYTGGPASGTATKTPPTSGAGSQQDEGLRPGDALGAQLLGALFNNIFAWLAYVTSNQIDGSLVIGGAALTFTPFTFTATSGTPGLLTATAHGLQTGDGPVRVSNSGGGLPGGLAAGTDYWVIFDTTNTLRLATSLADAVAADPVVITSNGTGTQTLSPGTSPTRLGDLTVMRGATVAGTLQTGRKATVGGLTLSVPSFVFTASSSTDKLTATDHGLLQGDGPVQVSNSGGALPAGLAAVTNYWVIFDTTSTIKLATSYANAVASVAIDLTTNGSGTNTLACTASTVRPADAEVTGTLTVDGTTTMSGAVTASSTVDTTGLLTAHAGLTASVNQDVTVSGTGGHRHGTQTLTISGFNFRAANGTTATYDASGSGTGIAFSGGQGVIAALPMLVGRRVTAARFYIHDNASPSTVLACAIDTRGSTNAQSTLAASSNSAGNGTDQTKTATVGSPAALAAGTALELFVKIQSGAGTCSLYMVEVDYDF